MQTTKEYILFALQALQLLVDVGQKLTTDHREFIHNQHANRCKLLLPLGKRIRLFVHVIVMVVTTSHPQTKKAVHSEATNKCCSNASWSSNLHCTWLIPQFSQLFHCFDDLRLASSTWATKVHTKWWWW